VRFIDAPADLPEQAYTPAAVTVMDPADVARLLRTPGRD
jgi:hypothetical protein